MSLKPDCVPCIMKQALNSAKVSGVDDEEMQFKILKEVYREIQNADGDSTPPKFSSLIQRNIKEFTNNDDPYKEVKLKNIENARKYIPYLQTYINHSGDKLEEAVRAAILGNVIDMGANPDFNLEDEIDKISSNNIMLDDYPAFKKDLMNAGYILYIADNAEEGVFDKMLIEQLLPRKIIFAVRDVPILNDITVDFAKRLGIDTVAEVISSGSNITGTDMSGVNDRFKKIFYEVPMVIAKGQGNYETLLREKRAIYFMFKVKCSVIAEICGKPVGMSVLYNNRRVN